MCVIHIWNNGSEMFKDGIPLTELLNGTVVRNIHTCPHGFIIIIKELVIFCGVFTSLMIILFHKKMMLYIGVVCFCSVYGQSHLYICDNRM